MAENRPKSQCSSCKHFRDPSEFKLSRSGQISKTCQKCSEKDASRYAAQKGLKRNRDDNVDVDGISDTAEFDGLSDLPVNIFLQEIEAAEDQLTLAACVDISELQKDDNCGKELKECANELTERIWERSKYRFIYHSCYESKREAKTRFMYICAQSEERKRKSKKGKVEGSEGRDRLPMSRFECHGWLHITLHNNSHQALVKITHKEHHVPYYCINVPEEIRTYVNENSGMRPSQLWDSILEKISHPSFSRKAVYYLWSKTNSSKWKMNFDELASSKTLLENDGGMNVDIIHLQDEPGYKALAFALPTLLAKWGFYLREFSLDSAWKTNGSNYEVFSLLGELHGSGCPLGFLFIKSNHGVPGGKERLIQQFLTHFRDVWNIKPIITLTDKDTSEINAFQNTFPSAKHQLCFWHCLRAVKTRLSVIRRQPRYYDVLEAKKEFPYIDNEFVPVAQAKKPLQADDLNVPTKMIPRVKIMFNNEFVKQPPVATPQPRLTIRLGGHIQAIVPLSSNSETSGLRVGEGSEDVENDEDDSDFIEHVDKVIKSLENEQDTEDGPDWMFENGESVSRDTSYVFCPAPHRAQILRLFTAHFCQHPIFPERRAGRLSGEEIRRNAVWEMYQFCRERNLREVWGYLWTAWYSPKMWKIWARSTTPYISRLRTTMNVENFWRQLKHDYLQYVTRPRLDQVIWILIHRVIPSYIAKTDQYSSTFRLGRTSFLTTYQKYFKQAWRKLEKKTTQSTISYTVNVNNWTCNCGNQKYNSHHLCKHLVQAVKPPPPSFWSEVVRRRKAPIYRHQDLVAREMSGEVKTATETTDGSITDGDDAKMRRGDDVLGGGGQWTKLVAESDPKIKVHLKTEQEEENRNNFIDLTLESEEEELSEAHTHTILRSSATQSMLSEDEDDQLDHAIESARSLVADLRAAADIIESQLVDPRASRIWLTAIERNNLGREVKELVHDIKREEGTSRKRDTTWAEGKGKEERRRVKNTMGYRPGLWNPRKEAS